MMARESELLVLSLHWLDESVEFGLADDEVVLDCARELCVSRLPLLFLEVHVGLLLLAPGIVVGHSRGQCLVLHGKLVAPDPLIPRGDRL